MLPLLSLFYIQGLSDVEEFVIYKTLRALAALTELNLLQKAILQELINEVVPFLSHPVSRVNDHVQIIYIC